MHPGSSSPEGGPEGSAARGNARNRAMDIPGAWASTFEGPGSLHSDDAAGLFGGGSSLSYGTSPGGHGMGYLMRSRRRMSRQESRDAFSNTLPSHDELGELADAAAAGTPTGRRDSLDIENGQQSPLAGANEDPKAFAFSQADLTAPLLPRAGAAPDDAVAPEGPAPRGSQAVRAVVFGLINATAGIPALVAYAAIVFRDPVYEQSLDLLCKFFFLSSAIHQAVFCLCSALPFAMGQVQDVGIIFLSAMATSIAGLTADAGRDAETALGTALLTMTVSTFLVGLATLFVARRHLAQLVKYIPLPVMGGYLAFVGYFCIASGVGLGVSVEIGTVASWAGLFHRLPLIKLAPTLAACAAMVVTLERSQHPLALPSVLVALVAVFHAVLYVSGVSLATAQESGWVMPPAAESVEFWKLWRLYHVTDWSLSGIYFPAALRQVAKAAGLLLVVVFGSCMDIAAIQADVPYKIDFDRELTTVALSNMATGLVGVGYTGSYIFSQTVFTMRAGVTSTLNGWVIAGVELLVFALPYSIVQFLPNYFLGALLLWFGVEISRDWLYLSYYKLTAVEYGLLWLTFGSIMQWGLEGGIAAGIVFSTLFFAHAYAASQVQSFRASTARSTVVRTVEHHAALDLLWGSHAATAALQGFVFFGSAQSIGTALREAAARLAGAGASAREERRRLEGAIQHSMRATGEDYAGAKHEAALAALAVAPKFLVVDLSGVSGIDSSGARTLADTVRDLGSLGVTPILAGAGHHGIADLLRVNDVRLREMRWPPELAPPGDEAAAAAAGGPEREGAAPEADGPEAFCFPTLQEGLRFCEDALLEVAVQFGLCVPPGAGTTLKDLLVSHLEKLPLTAPSNAEAMAATLRRYMGHRTVRRGEVLWRPDDPADELFLVERGVIRVDQLVRGEEGEGGARSVRIRSFELGPGCVAGSTDFYLARPHGTRAVCASVACRVLRLSRAAMARMAAEAPAALNVLQMAVMRANSSDLSTAADAAARVH